MDIADASNPPHPDCIIRLCSAVHRFSIPYINPKDQLSFEQSFKSCSTNHTSTRAVIAQADERRVTVKKNMVDGKLDHSELSGALVEYLPLINQILLSCKFQAEAARLDERLVFSWSSGIEHMKCKKKHYFDSEALMFELVMSTATLALSVSNVGCNECIQGNFASACKQFAKSAGVFQHLGEDLLPNWMANSRQVAEMEKSSLAETRVGCSVAFHLLFQGMAQQMAVVTVLVKPGVPNYTLVGKLCCGIAEELESFVKTLRSQCALHMQRMDPNFLTLITFTINVQRSLSLYFLSRSLWSDCEYGVAISALSEATVALRTRTSPSGRGLPQIESDGPLVSLVPEVNGFRLHMGNLLKAWEKDNSLIYFDKVPPSVPTNKALKAIQLKKCEKFTLEARDPLPLGAQIDVVEVTAESNNSNPLPPSYDEALINDPNLQEKVDEEMAKELHEKLNAL